MTDISLSRVNATPANAYPAEQMAAFLRRRRRKFPGLQDDGTYRAESRDDLTCPLDALRAVEAWRLNEIAKELAPEFWHAAGDEKYGEPEHQAAWQAWRALEAFGSHVEGAPLEAEVDLFAVDPAGIRVVWNSATPLEIVERYAPVFDQALRIASRGGLSAVHFHRGQLKPLEINAL